MEHTFDKAIEKNKRNKEERRKRMKNLFNSEQFLLAFTGIVSVWYACSWIIRILKSPKPYQRRQYLYIALALIVIILGISTFFTKFTLNCLCGAYVGVSAFIKLYREYRATPQKRDMFYIVLDGGAWGLSFFMFSLYLLLTLYLD